MDIIFVEDIFSINYYTISHLKMDNIAKYFYLIFVKNEGNITIFPEAFCQY